MIGIGVIGYHVRSRHSLEIYARSYPGAAIRAVAQDPGASEVLLEGGGTPDHVRAHAAKLGAEYCADYRAVLERDDVHLVSLMCEPGRAAGLVEEVAAAGKHLLSDKPMAGRVEDAERIAAAVRRHGVEMLVGFNTRYAPPFRRAWETVRGGGIGNPLAMHFTYCFGGKLAGFTASPEFAASFGGGDLTIAGCYAVDLLRWIAGREVEQVFARTGSFFFEDYRGVMEDLGQVTLTLAGGLPATILSGRLAAPDRPLDLDITGTRGSLRVSGDADSVTLQGETESGDADSVTLQGETSRREAYGPPAAERMVHHFLRCLERGEPSPIPPEEGLACVRVLQAAYESARTGRAVCLPKER